jgi:hypothetical protein
MISATRAKKIRSVHPTATAQIEWQALIDMMNEHTLFPLTNSWWTAGNIPGKKIQMLTYPAGIKMYEEQCRATLADFKGFEVEYEDGHAPQQLSEGELKKEVDGAIGTADELEKGIERKEVRIGA